MIAKLKSKQIKPSNGPALGFKLLAVWSNFTFYFKFVGWAMSNLQNIYEKELAHLVDRVILLLQERYPLIKQIGKKGFFELLHRIGGWRFLTSRDDSGTFKYPSRPSN